MIEEKAQCVARGDLSEEGAFARDLSDEEEPIMCRSRRERRCKATARAKALRSGLLSGLSNRKETSVAGSELGSERVIAGKEREASRGHAGPLVGGMGTSIKAEL